ncbi:hypothetical protein BD410DRAFT_804017 [Rickenella mellea]|uniref:Lysine-specific metallo-endopeptidase domain-containing protein n=1 Tax=Rickenella mellea TaxID=50990 RepID=A0A4Y7Q1V2_9AGAM|nr:hypothetical protein BD410DRAFT_804017 [Rickenella mellea]
MLFNSKLSSVLSLLCVIYAPQILAHPLSPRQAAVTLQVLNDSVDKKLGCPAAKISTLQTALTDASNIAAVAARTLSGVALSGSSPEAITTFLGITGTDLADGTTLRFTDVGNAYGGALTQITDLVAGNSDTTLRFYCPDIATTEPEGNPCDASALAVTENLAEGSINKMALCTQFFSGGSLAADTATYNAEKAAGKADSFSTPDDPALTLIHEAQHSVPLLDGHVDNVLEDIALETDACAALPADEKPTNAENWAIIAFLANVDPGRFS